MALRGLFYLPEAWNLPFWSSASKCFLNASAAGESFWLAW
jgi:hypothetical protein